MHVCNLVLDSGADTTVIAADLVPVASYTGETLRIAGVHSIGVEVPLARVKIMIGNQKIWLKAAVVEKPPHDILLGRDCENLQQLLRDALELQAEETKETVSVVTRQQAKASRKKSLAMRRRYQKGRMNPFHLALTSVITRVRKSDCNSGRPESKSDKID